jgi:hypothetical protein
MSTQSQTQVKVATQPSSDTMQAGILQRQCACGQHTIAGNECETCRQVHEGTLQRTAVSSAPVNDRPPLGYDVLSLPGQPLDAETRTFMEPRFGHDFSQVRVHTDAQAAESAQAVNALAYTVGRDVVFGSGQYLPRTGAGKELLAHELTHVVQQQGQPGNTSGNLAISHPDDVHEIEAERAAKTVMQGRPVPGTPLQSTAIHVQRQMGEVKVAEAHAEDEAVNKIIDSFDPCVKHDIGSKIEDRKEFLQSMRRYLGPDPNTEKHFQGVKPVKKEIGDFCLHEEAAKHLEQVHQELGDAMPTTSVGFGLRNRFRMHDRHSKGLMAHPLGYGVDYRATTNPMVTDPRLVKLLELETGGATHFEFDMGRKERRELITELGKDRVDPESDRAKHFFDQFEKEYQRVSQASKDFTTSLPEQSRTTLARLRDKYLEIRPEMSKIRPELHEIERKLIAKAKGTKKSGNGIDKEEQKLQERKQKLETREHELETDIQDIQNQLKEVFGKWLTDIEKKMTSIQSEAEKAGLNIHSIPTKQELDKEERERKSLSRSTHSSKTRAEGTIKSLDDKIGRERARGQRGRPINEAAIAEWNSRIEKLRSEATQEGKEEISTTTRLAEIKQLREWLSKKADYDVLESLKKSLLTDLDFVFGTKKQAEVKNPSVVQLSQKGFFTPDPEKARGAKPDPKHDSAKYGFNLAFMKAMARHGFDQGITWNPGSTDPMHFDFVEGVESILDVKTTSKEEKVKKTQ